MDIATDEVHQPAVAVAVAVEGAQASRQAQGQGQAQQGWTVPDSMFRLYMFLTQEREHILLRLMSTVTVHTVNHENICCLNTALLILVLAEKRYVTKLLYGYDRL
jgi:hypothetical protein